MINFDTVLVDINCVGHLAYASFDGNDNDMKDIEIYIERLLDLYFTFPFLKTDKFVVFGDSPPYWRSRVLSRKTGAVYKGTRAEKPLGKYMFLQAFMRMSQAILKPHFEADDLIAQYVVDHPEEKICILTVDSDLLQLAKDNVTWFCCKGYNPQVRSESNGNLKKWLDGKFEKLSKKRIGHLDTSKAQTIIDWKVIYADRCDNIPAGEDQREIIDLKHPTRYLRVSDNHPEFYQECEKKKRTAVQSKTPYKDVDAYMGLYLTGFPTKFPTAKDWGNV